MQLVSLQILSMTFNHKSTKIIHQNQKSKVKKNKEHKAKKMNQIAIVSFKKQKAKDIMINSWIKYAKVLNNSKE